MKFIGNSSDVIDWPSLIKSLPQGRFRGTDQDDDIHHNPKVEILRQQWQDAGYDGNKAVGWFDYDVDKDITNRFGVYVHAKPIGAWITSVPPGYVVPWHYDINDQEEMLLSKGKVLRFTCHIGEPSWGQVFVLNDHVFHMPEQGDVYQWEDWQDWHGGMNMGLKPKYLFNFLGYAYE